MYSQYNPLLSFVSVNSLWALMSVGWSVCQNLQNGGNLHLHASIGAHVFLVICLGKPTYFVGMLKCFCPVDTEGRRDHVVGRVQALEVLVPGHNWSTIRDWRIKNMSVFLFSITIVHLNVIKWHKRSMHITNNRLIPSLLLYVDPLFCPSSYGFQTFSMVQIYKSFGNLEKELLTNSITWIVFYVLWKFIIKSDNSNW